MDSIVGIILFLIILAVSGIKKLQEERELQRRRSERKTTRKEDLPEATRRVLYGTPADEGGGRPIQRSGPRSVLTAEPAEDMAPGQPVPTAGPAPSARRTPPPPPSRRWESLEAERTQDQPSLEDRMRQRIEEQLQTLRERGLPVPETAEPDAWGDVMQRMAEEERERRRAQQAAARRAAQQRQATARPLAEPHEGPPPEQEAARRRRKLAEERRRLEQQAERYKRAAAHPVLALRTKEGLRSAFILREILGPPRAFDDNPWVQ